MNATENRLREALDGAARTVQPDDLRPLETGRAPSRFGRRVLIAATASGLAVAAAGVVLWPTPSDLASAWSAAPQRADPDLVAELGEHCLSMDEILPADHREQPVIVDLRGNSAVVIVDLRASRSAARGQAGPYALSCSFLGIDRSAGVLKFVAANAGLIDYPIEPVGDSVFTVESMSRSGAEGDALSEISGQAGPTVDHLVVTLDDGTELQATVQDGWYVAWWPERSRGLLPWKLSQSRRMPTLVRAYDASGKLLKQLVPEGVPGR
ncbi:hypothetical protein [Flindersiella endophytica]